MKRQELQTMATQKRFFPRWYARGLNHQDAPDSYRARLDRAVRSPGVVRWWV